MQSNNIHSGMKLDMKFCNSATNINNTEIQKLVSSTQSYICRSPKKSRRLRSSFTTEQLNYLEREFKKFPYIGNVNRQELAKNLNIPERAIKIWFQNRRMKEKKESNKEEDNTNQFISIKITNNQLNNVKLANDERSLNIGSNEAKYVAIKSRITGNAPINYTAKDAREQEITTTTEVIDNIDIGKTDKEHLQSNERKMEYQNPTDMKHLTLKNVTASFGKTDQDNRSTKQNISAYVSQPQDMPEDLSQTPRNKAQIELNNLNSQTEAATVPIYIPNCYTPSYVPGNVLWNPNMGIITNGAVPTPYQPNTYIVNQQTLRKSNCNCDCHLQLVPQVTENPGPYIPVFTIPYTTHLQ